MASECDEELNLEEGAVMNVEEGNVEYFRNYRPIKNTNKRFTMIAEENAKEALRELDIDREKYAQRLSRLYGAGSDSDIIKSDLQRRKRHELTLNLDKYQSTFTRQEASTTSSQQLKEPNEKQRLLQMTDSLLHSTREKHHPELSHHSGAQYNQYSLGDWKGSVCTRAQTDNHPHLRTHTAMSLLDRCDQGRYAVPLIPSPYDSKFLVSPSSPPSPHHSLRQSHRRVRTRPPPLWSGR
jgi:hypothetical protein